MRPAPARPSLVLTCAVLGAVAGQKVADFLGYRPLRRPFYHLLPEVWHGLPPVGLALCAGLCVGVALRPALRSEVQRAVGWMVAAVAAACLAGSAAVRMMTSTTPWDSSGEDAAAGLGCAIALMPVLGASLAATRRVGRARRGSLVDASDRRAVLLPAAAAAALSPLVNVVLGDWAGESARCMPFAVSRVLAALGVVALAALLLADLVALARAKRAAARAARMQRRGADTPGLVGTPLLLDFGLGGGVAVDPLPPAGYRERDAFQRAIVGDPALARAALRRAVMLGAAVLIASAACLLGVWEGPGGECLAPWDS